MRPGRRGKRVPFSRSCGIARPDPTLVVPAQDVGLADENEFLTVQIDWGRSVFLVEDLIARFEDRRLEDLFLFPFGFTSPRSEERRVGKECRLRMWHDNT